VPLRRGRALVRPNGMPRGRARPRQAQSSARSASSLNTDESADRIRNPGGGPAQQDLADARVEQRTMGQTTNAVAEQRECAQTRAKARRKRGATGQEQVRDERHACTDRERDERARRCCRR
jgi:hypothetical protein